MVSELIYLEGHVIDSLTLSKVLDLLAAYGVGYHIQKAEIGHMRDQISHFEILVSAETEEKLQTVLKEVQQHGAIFACEDAHLQPAPADGIFPENFYATTNLDTYVRVEGKWIPVEPIQMNCAIRLRRKKGEWRAEVVPMIQVHQGDLIVVGYEGVRVALVERRDPTTVFAFMGGDISLEKPKERAVQAVAEEVRRVKRGGEKVLFVAGPAIVQTGAAPYLEELVHNGWVDTLFAENLLAVSDLEAALFGTVLGVSLELGAPVQYGHANHLRAVNAIRAAGSLKRAVKTGILKKGILHACITRGVELVLTGSIGDDALLPETISDLTDAQEAMRAKLRHVGIAVMVAAPQQAAATLNLLPARVTTLYVDHDAETVTRLIHRSPYPAYGLVTDCHFFIKELSRHLQDSGG